MSSGGAASGLLQAVTLWRFHRCPIPSTPTRYHLAQELLGSCTLSPHSSHLFFMMQIAVFFTWKIKVSMNLHFLSVMWVLPEGQDCDWPNIMTMLNGPLWKLSCYPFNRYIFLQVLNQIAETTSFYFCFYFLGVNTEPKVSNPWGNCTREVSVLPLHYVPSSLTSK